MITHPRAPRAQGAPHVATNCFALPESPRSSRPRPWPFSPAAFAQADQQKLVADAETVMSNFLRDPEMKWLQQNLRRAKAVLIAPEMRRPLHQSAARRACRARGQGSEERKWAGPAFYTLATASVASRPAFRCPK